VSGGDLVGVTILPPPPSAGGGGAPTDATYVVVSLNATLTSERQLTAGSNITLVDGGANGNITINAAAGATTTNGQGIWIGIDGVDGPEGDRGESGTAGPQGISGSLIGVEFTATGSGTWNVPNNISAVWVTMVAGGSGGSASTAAANGGGGGGSGESVEGEFLKVTASSTVAYTVGTGGASATNGNDTVFGALTVRGGVKGLTTVAGTGGGARGGVAGTGGSAPGNQGGVGFSETATYQGGSGGGSGGTTTTTNGGAGGGSGGQLVGGAGGIAGGTQAGGGGGAATIYGVGGAGGAGGAVGVAAASTAYGTGGGGAGGFATGKAGGAGAGGYILITYIG